jgi:uncharacterized OB-fold protein
MTDRPLPVIDSDSQPYWEATARHELRLPFCLDCDKSFFMPRVLCPRCHGDRVEWRAASGTGVIYSYTVARRPAGLAFAARVPYVVALIDLDEGVRLLSQVITDDVAAVRIGQRVHVDFEDVAEGLALPVFRIVSG